jgi:hypothetical protein
MRWHHQALAKLHFCLYTIIPSSDLPYKLSSAMFFIDLQSRTIKNQSPSLILGIFKPSEGYLAACYSHRYFDFQVLPRQTEPRN